jgi:pimeloyl-ACP methyl ester carboxylesterase
MPSLGFAPALALLAAFGRTAPDRSLRTLLRTAAYRIRPPRPEPHAARIDAAQARVLASGTAGLHQRADILCERRQGRLPTIVLGGFVPDATEQVFLLRGFLLRRGSVYYVQYPRRGFSTDLLCAQLDDLVEELATLEGTPPVVLSVSFGAGLALEWLRRNRVNGRTPSLAGLACVSPVACLEDVVSPADAKPTTLLGRALRPLLEESGMPEARSLERSRSVFTRMFEAGAQNKATLATLMTGKELVALHRAVLACIQGVTPDGARERVAALRALRSPVTYFSPAHLPLTPAPTLLLYAEKEEAVVVHDSPTRFALGAAHRAYFPHSRFEVVGGGGRNPVQHASLIFHVFEFLPPLKRFFASLGPVHRRRAA